METGHSNFSFNSENISQSCSGRSERSGNPTQTVQPDGFVVQKKHVIKFLGILIPKRVLKKI